MCQEENIRPLLIDLVKQGFNPKGDKISLKLSYNRQSLGGSSPDRLHQLIWAKDNLIKETLAIDNLPLEVTDEKVSLDRSEEIDLKESEAYQPFSNHLVDYAKKRARVIAQPREYENPRYAFRYLLPQLGLIRSGYKETGKTLLGKFHGSCAFRKEAANHVWN